MRIVKSRKLALKEIPIVEYPLNSSRLGIVEIIKLIADAINTVQSNRLDGIENFVQCLWVLYNCEIDSDAASALRDAGLIKLKSFGENKADIKEIISELNQQETQVLVDYMYQTMLNIIGMPNRNGGSSTSDTGAATLVRDGWETTERRAKKDEKKFKSAERRFLKIALQIVRATVGTELKLYDIDVKFPARSYKNKMAMAQMLTTMLGCDKIHPLLAFTECELFDDPQAAYQMSMDYYEKVKAEQAKQAEKQPPNPTEKGGESVA
jgi:SPP1 family phage portal protein